MPIYWRFYLDTDELSRLRFEGASLSLSMVLLSNKPDGYLIAEIGCHFTSRIRVSPPAIPSGTGTFVFA